ncbi:MAG TPA: hypothetical protein VLV25_06605 [Steroidobacteraceae bacterium]|nr:hypothetical protein [Steroidobacteraceae bacterium]
MHEAVIVIADVYRLSDEPPGGLAAEPGALAGLEYAGRFGERERLEAGWREWLVRWLGRGDLAGVSVAAVAGAATGTEAATRWIATPVELVAGLTRVHLDRRGIVRLTAEEQAVLADAFHQTFAGSGAALQPLSDGQFLALTPGIAAVATAEPARCAGGLLVVPQGAAAAPLLRLIAEIEMWLHGAALNEARLKRGAAPVTALWLWGAMGTALPHGRSPPPEPANGARHGATAVFGSDAFVAGLLSLDGRAMQTLPQRPEAVFADVCAERAVVVVELAGELPGEEWSLPAAAAALDRRLIQPALAALRDGSLKRLTLIANDTRIALGRRSGLKRWRRPRSGLEALA